MLLGVHLQENPLLSCGVETYLNVFTSMGETNSVVQSFESHLSIAINLPFKLEGRQKVVDPLEIEQHPFPFGPVRAAGRSQSRMGLERGQTVTITGPTGELMIVQVALLV